MERSDMRLAHPGGQTAFVSFCAKFAAALTAAAFLLLLILSLVNTCSIDPARYYDEHILFLKDSVWQNLIAMAALLLLFFLLRRYAAPVRAPRRDRVLICVSLSAVLAIGALFIRSAQLSPAGDSLVVTDIGREFSRGDFSALTSIQNRCGAYYRYYPYQLGITGYFALLQALLGRRAFAPIALINVFLLVAGYGAILRITREAFSDTRVTALTALLFLLFPQAIFFCAFLYGSVPAFALSLWGVALTLLYLRTRRLPIAAAGILLLSVAVVLKKNAMIPAIACCILLLLFGLSKKRVLPLILAALCVMLPVLSVSGVTKAFERRAGADLGPGAPTSLWLLIGLSESERAPGWNVSYVDTYALETPEQTEERLAPLLSERRAALSSPAAALSFFSRKLQSQWDEPTFESIWVSRAGRGQPASALEAALWRGEQGGWLFSAARVLVPFFYGCFSAGLIRMLLRDRRRFFGPDANLAALALPLIVLGAFLYHLVFEAKSQYAVLYLPMLFPTAGYFLLSFLSGERKETKESRR